MQNGKLNTDPLTLKWNIVSLLNNENITLVSLMKELCTPLCAQCEKCRNIESGVAKAYDSVQDRSQSVSYLGLSMNPQIRISSFIVQKIMIEAMMMMV